MSQSTEEYLDSLLRQAMGIKDPEPVQTEVINEYQDNSQVADDIPQPFSDDELQNISLGTSTVVTNDGVEFSSGKANEFFATEAPFENDFVFPQEALIPEENVVIPDEMKITEEGEAILSGSMDFPTEDSLLENASVEETLPVDIPIEETTPSLSIDDLDPADANKAMDPDMIAALFASANAEDVSSEGTSAEETLAEETSVEEASVEEISVEEASTDDITLDDISMDDIPIEDTIPSLSIDDLDPADANKAMDPDMIAALFASANAEASDVPGQEELHADDEISDLLNSLDNIDEAIANDTSASSGDLDFNGLDLGDVDLSAMLDDINKEVENNTDSADDFSAADLNELLNSVDGDEDLSDIGSLLNKDEKSELINPGMASFEGDDSSYAFDLNESLSEEEEDPKAKKKREKEEKKRKKKEEKEKKKNKKKKKDDFEEFGLDGEEVVLDLSSDEFANFGLEEEKKEGFIKRLLNKLFEEEEEEPVPEKASVIEQSAVDIAAEGAAENEEILKQLKEEPEPEEDKGKKGKKKKKDDDLEEDEDNSKDKKKKKKEKKVKEEEPELPTKKLPKKKVFASLGLCLTFAALLVVLAYFLPYSIEKSRAKKFNSVGDYGQVYENLRGKKLNEEEQILYERAFTVLKAERPYKSYENYMKMGKKLEALNALVQGVQVMDEYSEKANVLGVGSDFGKECDKIVNELSNTFNVSVDQARYWYQMEGTEDYSRALYDHLYNLMPRDENGNLIYFADEANRELVLTEEEDL